MTLLPITTLKKMFPLLLMWSTGLILLGLLGFVIYVTNMHTKEIGIRKIVGATVAQIVALLSKDFLKLIAIAFVIAIPIAMLLMHGSKFCLSNSFKLVDIFGRQFSIALIILLCKGSNCKPS